MNSEDRKKAIGLVVGILFVFGFAFWRISSEMSPSVAVAPAPEAVAAPATDAPLVANATAPPVAESDIIINDEFAPIAADPFRSVVSNGGVPQSAPVNRTSETKVKDSTVPPFPIPGPALIQAKSENIELSGVVGGKKPLAIVVVDQESFIVGIGQKFGSGYVVSSIGRDTIKLRHGKSIISLSIGQQAQHLEGIQNRFDSTTNQIVTEQSDDDLLMVMQTPSDGDDSDEMAEIDPPTLFAQSGVDPFREVLAKSPKATVKPSVKGKSKTTRKKTSNRQQTRSDFGDIPPAIPGEYVPLQGTLPDPAIETVRPPEMSVSGIITGQNAVVIVHIGDKTYVIGKGESFADGCQVVEIGRDFVRIRRGKDVIRLSVTEEPAPNPDT